MHWCYNFCTGGLRKFAIVFQPIIIALVLHLKCTALSQSESSNFFTYIIKGVNQGAETVQDEKSSLYVQLSKYLLGYTRRNNHKTWYYFSFRIDLLAFYICLLAFHKLPTDINYQSVDSFYTFKRRLLDFFVIKPFFIIFQVVRVQVNEAILN